MMHPLSYPKSPVSHTSKGRLPTRVLPLSQMLPYRSARDWSFRLKILISIGSIVSFLVITLTTSIYIASIPGIMDEFQVGQTLAISPVTLYAMGFTIGPMCTAALSEEFGRQYIYKTSLFLHFILTIIAGTAKNFDTIVICRTLSGIVGSPAVSVFAGVLNDLWDMPQDRFAVPLFVLYGLGGTIAPEIGPIIGEAIVASSGWRWTFWLTAILVGACFLMMLFVPETFEPEIKRKALSLPRGDLGQALGSSCKQPIHMLMVEPIIFPTAVVVTMSQVVIFILYAAYPVVLEQTYGFTSYQVGLAFLPLLIGSLMAAPVLSWVDRHKCALQRPVPEDNLPGAMIAAVILPISLFWLAWTARPTIHWIWPLMAGVPYGLGFALSQLVYPLYKNEIYSHAGLATSSLAIDVFMRYAVSCVFPLFTIKLVDDIGFCWVMTTCGLMMVALAPVPWSLRRYGPLLRERSPYLNRTAPKDDLPPMQEVSTFVYQRKRITLNSQDLTFVTLRSQSVIYIARPPTGVNESHCAICSQQIKRVHTAIFEIGFHVLHRETISGLAADWHSETNWISPSNQRTRKESERGLWRTFFTMLELDCTPNGNCFEALKLTEEPYPFRWQRNRQVMGEAT